MISIILICRHIFFQQKPREEHVLRFFPRWKLKTEDLWGEPASQCSQENFGSHVPRRTRVHRFLPTCRGHPGNHLHTRVSLSIFCCGCQKKYQYVATGKVQYVGVQEKTIYEYHIHLPVRNIYINLYIYAFNHVSYHYIPYPLKSDCAYAGVFANSRRSVNPWAIPTHFLFSVSRVQDCQVPIS